MIRGIGGATPSYSNFYCGVSMRHLTRPLLIKPDVLKPAEEAYFLPYVFGIYESETRGDYIDLHGSRITGPGPRDDGGLRSALNAALGAARVMESVPDAPEKAWLAEFALGLRMWASEVRSIHNFYLAQLIRDRNKEVLAAKPRIPDKTPTWTGDPDYLEWFAIQRDEFDNASELIRLLETGGLPLFFRAPNQRYEDTFVIGPGIINALERKTQLMRDHWLDAQTYLAAPLK